MESNLGENQNKRKDILNIVILGGIHFALFPLNCPSAFPWESAMKRVSQPTLHWPDCFKKCPSACRKILSSPHPLLAKKQPVSRKNRGDKFSAKWHIVPVMPVIKTSSFPAFARGWLLAVCLITSPVFGAQSTHLHELKPGARGVASATSPAGTVNRVIADLNPELISVEPGSFAMGSSADEPLRNKAEGPWMQVTLTKGFWLGKSQLAGTLQREAAVQKWPRLDDVL